VEVPPEQAYGPKARVKPQRVLRSKFPAEADVKRGARFFLRAEDGRPIPVWVTRVDGREVQITTQHPLAGVTLRFEVTVREVRDATDEEKAHGHPHGPGGHEHDG
jgi:FKBP-type peptidyl-prolyl cis-trans isomerase SlyD